MMADLAYMHKLQCLEGAGAYILNSIYSRPSDLKIRRIDARFSEPEAQAQQGQ